MPLKTIWITQYEKGCRVYRTLMQATAANVGLGKIMQNPIKLLVQADNVKQWEVILLAAVPLKVRGGDADV